MFESRGGHGLYYSPAETQVVARRITANEKSARTPEYSLTESEYSLSSIQSVLSELLPDAPSVVDTLGRYTEGLEAVEAVLSLLPVSSDDKEHLPVANLLAAVAVEGVAERYAYNYSKSGPRQEAWLLQGLPEELYEYVMFGRRQFAESIIAHSHMKWFFRDLVGRVKDLIHDDPSFEKKIEHFPWLLVSVGEPYYQAAVQCLPIGNLRMVCRRLFQESEQGLYPSEAEALVEDLEKIIEDEYYK